MTHSYNAIKISETCEPVHLHIFATSNVTTTITTTITTTTTTSTLLTRANTKRNSNDVSSFVNQELNNSPNNIESGNLNDNDYNIQFNHNYQKNDGRGACTFKIPSTSLGLRKPTRVTTKTINGYHHKKPLPIDSTSRSCTSKSSDNNKNKNAFGYHLSNYDNGNDCADNDNRNNESDIYSYHSLESLSLDTYSSTSTTAETDVTITTNTTNTTLALESCCSIKSLQPSEELRENGEVEKEAEEDENERSLVKGKRQENEYYHKNSKGYMSPLNISSSPAFSNAKTKAVMVPTIKSHAHQMSYKSPMYIIKIQTLQLKQTLATSAQKRKSQDNKCRKNSISNSNKVGLSAQVSSPTSSTTHASNASIAATAVAEIGIRIEGKSEIDDIVGVSHNNKLKHSCTTSYLPSALNEMRSGTTTNVHKRTLSSSSYRSGTSHISVHTVNSTLSSKISCKFWTCLRWLCVYLKNSGIGEPSVHHALIVIFLEFFAWGLLTMPVIAVLNQTFPDHTFLMNGLVMGIKGILSFLSAPLIGALSDIWGRKFFLLITVFFTCAPIPLMTINTWWFFAMISISGIFAVTFSVVFAYVADVTTVEGRSRAYGLVSATFAASMVISPALGAALMEKYSDTLVVALATAIAVLDVFFILVAVPESLPDKVRPSSWGAPINWEQADPFSALRKVGSDHTILMQCVTVLLSYLPEAGQYSCIFVYLKLKMSFNTMEVAIFIAVVGILSISVQVTLGYLMRKVGAKQTIILGLILEMTQLFWYGFGSQKWMMWAAGILAALGSITYPAISAFVSIHSTADSQGAVQGMVTGMRGLCNGLGPAMYGIIFYLFNVDLNDEHALLDNSVIHAVNGNASSSGSGNGSGGIGKWLHMPGPPFVFGGFMVILAILVALFIPEYHSEFNIKGSPIEKKRISLDVQYEIECGPTSTSPLMHSDSLAQL